MKKIKSAYLLIIVILFFCNKNNVYAAQELTCIYEKVVLIQTTGEIEVYTNEKDVKLNEDGWVKQETEFFEVETQELTSCPNYYVLKKDFTNLPKDLNFFHEDIEINKRARKDLKEQKKHAEKPKVVTIDNSSTNTGIDIGCSEIKDWDQAWLSNEKGTLSCLYIKSIGESKCNIIQVSVHQSDNPIIKIFNNEENAETKTDITYDRFVSTNIGSCPIGLRVDRKVHNDETTGFDSLINTEIKLGGSAGENYVLKNFEGKNLITGKKITEDIEINFGFVENKIVSCEELFSGEDGKKLLELLVNIRKIVQILVPIIIIGLGILDMAKAVFSDNEDGMKKAQGKLIKRIIIGAAFFLVPILLNLVLGIANSIWPSISPNLCGII